MRLLILPVSTQMSAALDAPKKPRAPSLRLFSVARVGNDKSQSETVHEEHDDLRPQVTLAVNAVPDAPQSSVPHPCEFFLSQGWESTNLNPNPFMRSDAQRNRKPALSLSKGTGFLQLGRNGGKPHHSLRARSIVWVAFAFLALALPALGDPGPVLELDYSNPGLTPAHWVLSLAPDGSGHFRSERGNAPIDSSQGFESANVDRDIKVSPEFAIRVFEAVRQHGIFNSGCESHMKVAFQGWKKLTYSGPDGAGACTFNYSKDKQIQSLGESLVAVAAAIIEGARLETLLQHDRLGLDKEMEYLTEAAEDGRIQQVGAIRGILERLADDQQVMERVRKRARILLARAEG